MIQVCIKHIVSHILYGISLFLVTFACLCDNEGQIVSSSGLYFKNKRCIGNPMICQLFMACDLLYLLVKYSHKLEDKMAIYDNMRTNVVIVFNF